MTLAIVLILSMLFWGELRAYIWGEAAFTFDVEHHIGQDMQINVDMTVAMQCHCELMRPSDEAASGLCCEAAGGSRSWMYALEWKRSEAWGRGERI